MSENAGDRSWDESMRLLIEQLSALTPADDITDEEIVAEVAIVRQERAREAAKRAEAPPSES